MGYSQWYIHWVNAELLLRSLGTTIGNQCPKTYDLLTIKDNLYSLWLSLWGETCFLILPIFGLDFCFKIEVELAKIVGTNSGERVWVLNAKNTEGMKIFSIRSEASSYSFPDLFHPQPLCLALCSVSLYILYLSEDTCWDTDTFAHTDPVCFVWVR